jgi:hypothetical protein
LPCLSKNVRNYEAEANLRPKGLTSPFHLLGMDHSQEQVEHRFLLNRNIGVSASFRNTSWFWTRLYVHKSKSFVAWREQRLKYHQISQECRMLVSTLLSSSFAAPGRVAFAKSSFTVRLKIWFDDIH